MRYLIFLVLMLTGFATHAQPWEDRKLFSNGTGGSTLRILSSTDTSFFEPIIKSYLAKTPNSTVEYLVTGTASLDQMFRNTPEAFDIAISSAMDLQLKLVNDGFAQPIDDAAHPTWATWRQSLFAFTMEPAAIVINKAAFAGHEVPKTRQDLIQHLRARPDFFRNKLGTYDVRQSGLGYLFATQDARASETYWRLMEVMGGLGTKLYCCSGAMIDDLTDGTIAVAYNVLGSYAAGRTQTNPKIDVILPSDFPTTMMRTALVSKSAQSSDKAKQFVRHLISVQSGANTAPANALPPLLKQPGQQTIALEPALMTYLDRLKRQTFVTEWERAIIQ